MQIQGHSLAFALHNIACRDDAHDISLALLMKARLVARLSIRLPLTIYDDLMK